MAAPSSSDEEFRTKAYFAVDDAARWLDQAQHGLDGHALAAAALADNAHDLARIDVEIDAVHGLDDAFVEKKIRFEIAYR